ncbi:E3 SUMO-protein ligase NSE2-like [Musca vetustissima]|uniref:E3 SUMO-protein ligase NSE2-like n=1 Tax=Musca vetustissima TaxID=27455 RepID=UPI002AB69C13|nr:E3 SUMO-protein ligase NSE2-like [Musca vetustissima]
MNAQLKSDLENARQCLLDTYNLALTFGGPDTQNPETYLNLAADLCVINEQFKRHEASLECAKEARTTSEFVEEYQKQQQNKENKKYNAKNTSEFKNFRDQLMQIKNLQDEANASVSGAGQQRVECDEFVMESEINVYDPITKQRMSNPVKNTLCGHHYEKCHILEAISVNKRLRCPVAGCGNKQFVQQQHLVDDNLFKVRLQKMAEQEEEEEEE